MAKRKGPSRSNAIRDFLRKNPKASAKETIDALAKEGLKISSALFYNVKGRMAQIKVQKARKARRVAHATQKSGSTDPITLVKDLKLLAQRAGGMGNLARLVQVLAD